MPANLTYRTAGVWGGGNGSDLTATQVDQNFFTLFSAVSALEDHADTGAGIDFINQPGGGNLFYIHLTNHAVLGPFVIPTAQWNPRGAWTPNTVYAAFDVVSENGSVYLITVPHTSGTTFSAFSTDGMGHTLYSLILTNPSDVLPVGGTAGMRLVKSTGSPFASEWLSDQIRIHLFVEGQPSPNETLIQFPVADNMTIPAGLTGSVIYQRIPTASVVSYTLFKNGASIGIIEFAISPEVVIVAFTADVHCVPGDIISLVGPAVPDHTQTDISFTILAALTL
jgi:hypothetical protein